MPLQRILRSLAAQLMVRIGGFAPGACDSDGLDKLFKALVAVPLKRVVPPAGGACRAIRQRQPEWAPAAASGYNATFSHKRDPGRWRRGLYHAYTSQWRQQLANPPKRTSRS